MSRVALIHIHRPGTDARKLRGRDQAAKKKKKKKKKKRTKERKLFLTSRILSPPRDTPVLRFFDDEDMPPQAFHCLSPYL